jgi:hypothetical protein
MNSKKIIGLMVMAGVLASSLSIAFAEESPALSLPDMEKKGISSLGTLHRALIPTEKTRKNLIKLAYKGIKVAEILEIGGGIMGAWKHEWLNQPNNPSPPVVGLPNYISISRTMGRGLIGGVIPLVSLLKMGALGALYTQKEERNNLVFSPWRLTQSVLLTGFSFCCGFFLLTSAKG